MSTSFVVGRCLSTYPPMYAQCIETSNAAGVATFEQGAHNATRRGRSPASRCVRWCVYDEEPSPTKPVIAADFTPADELHAVGSLGAKVSEPIPPAPANRVVLNV